MSDDPKLSQRYRELPREEPPRALDERILAASRRAVQRRRWYGPLAAAAVITLAVAVSLHVQHDRPGEEVDAVSPSMQVQEVPKNETLRQAPAREARRDAAGPGFAPDPKPAANADLASAASPRSAEAPAPAPVQAPAPAAAPAEAPAKKPAPAAQAEQSSGAAKQGMRVQRAGDLQRNRAEIAQSSVAVTPEAELERIARLRAEGKHDEADKALAEFRKRHPDYRFSEEMKAKVEKPQ